MLPASPRSSPLLQPTLGAGAPAAAPLSPQATFFTSFFGGPWAALAVGAVNLARLRRARREAWLVALAALIAVAALAATAIAVARPELIAAWVPSGFRPSTAVRRLNNGLGIASWSFFYLRLRPEYRAAELTGGFASRSYQPLVAVAGGVPVGRASFIPSTSYPTDGRRRPRSSSFWAKLAGKERSVRLDSIHSLRIRNESRRTTGPW